MDSGIYRLQVGDLFYIGKTGALARREREHRAVLKRGKHQKKALQLAAHAGEPVEFTIICYAGARDLDELESAEQAKHSEDPRCVNQDGLPGRGQHACRIGNVYFESATAAAEHCGVPYSTLKHWLSRGKSTKGYRTYYV